MKQQPRVQAFCRQAGLQGKYREDSVKQAQVLFLNDLIKWATSLLVEGDGAMQGRREVEVFDNLYPCKLGQRKVRLSLITNWQSWTVCLCVGWWGLERIHNHPLVSFTTILPSSFTFHVFNSQTISWLLVLMMVQAQKQITYSDYVIRGQLNKERIYKDSGKVQRKQGRERAVLWGRYQGWEEKCDHPMADKF